MRDQMVGWQTALCRFLHDDPAVRHPPVTGPARCRAFADYEPSRIRFNCGARRRLREPVAGFRQLCLLFKLALVGSCGLLLRVLIPFSPRDCAIPRLNTVPLRTANGITLQERDF